MIRTLLPLLEAGLNRGIALDPEAAMLLAPVRNRRMAVHVEGPAPASVVVTFAHDRVTLTTDCDRPVDVSLRGTPAALASLWARGDELPAGARVTVSGEIGVLEQIRDLLRRLRPDWEEPLARLVGDELGHPLAQGLRTLVAGAARAARELEITTAEFIREESGWLADREQVRHFGDEVDQLRDAVERLEKRIHRLDGQQ